MRNFLLVALLGAFGVTQQLKAEETSSNNTLDYTFDNAYKLDGKDVYGEHDLNYTHKLSDALKVAFQGHFVEHYRVVGEDGKVENATYEDKFWRVKFIGSPFVNVAGFKTGWEVRYLLPVDSASQKAGTYGSLSPRFNMSREYSSHYSLTVIPKISLPLNRKSYQVNSADKAANNVFAFALEVASEWKILPELSLVNDAEVSSVLKGKAPYATKNPTNEISYAYNFSNELSLNYTLKNFYDLGVAGFWQVDYDFGNAALGSSEASIEKGSHHVLGLRLAKTFNL